VSVALDVVLIHHELPAAGVPPVQFPERVNDAAPPVKVLVVWACAVPISSEAYVHVIAASAMEGVRCLR
jgi:hypothetical protein